VRVCDERVGLSANDEAVRLKAEGKLTEQHKTGAATKSRKGNQLHTWQSNHKSVHTKGQPQKEIKNATLTNFTAGKKNVKVGEAMVLELLKTKNTCIAYKRASIMVQDQLWFRISTHKASTAEIWKRKKPF